MVGKVVGVVVESELVSNVVLADGLEVRNILAGDHIPVQTRADVVFALEVGDTFGYFSDGFVDLGLLLGPFSRSFSLSLSLALQVYGILVLVIADIPFPYL